MNANHLDNIHFNATQIQLIFVDSELEHPVKSLGINCSIFSSIMHIFICDNTKKILQT